MEISAQVGVSIVIHTYRSLSLRPSRTASNPPPLHCQQISIDYIYSFAIRSETQSESSNQSVKRIETRVRILKNKEIIVKMRFLLLACLAVAAVSATEQVCEPGSTKMEDCNRCFCLNDGSAWACTLMACPATVCQPGSTYQEFCNTCTCGSDGSSVACTRKSCPEGVFNEDGSLKHPEEVAHNPLLRQTRQVSDDAPCVPGERFKKYCNTCTCGSDGFSIACTRKACPKAIFNEDGSLKHPEQVAHNPLLRQTRQVSDDRPCVPGERFKKYCNTCTCGSDGFSVACTRKACPKGIFNEDGSLKHPEQVAHNPLLRQTRQVSDDAPCVPGERFKKHCNTCTCGSDGFSVACTRRACPIDFYNEDGSLKHREGVVDQTSD